MISFFPPKRVYLDLLTLAAPMGWMVQPTHLAVVDAAGKVREAAIRRGVGFGDNGRDITGG